MDHQNPQAHERWLDSHIDLGQKPSASRKHTRMDACMQIVWVEKIINHIFFQGQSLRAIKSGVEPGTERHCVHLSAPAEYPAQPNPKGPRTARAVLSPGISLNSERQLRPTRSPRSLKSWIIQSLDRNTSSTPNDHTASEAEAGIYLPRLCLWAGGHQ